MHTTQRFSLAAAVSAFAALAIACQGSDLFHFAGLHDTGNSADHSCPGSLACPTIGCCPAGFPFSCLNGACAREANSCPSNYETCGPGGWSSAGPVPTCSPTDMGCILSHLRVQDYAGGPMILTTIPSGTVTPAQISMGKGLPSLSDTVTSAPSLTFSSWDTCIELTLSFIDPNGAKVGGCFNVHPRGQPSGTFGSFATVGYRSVADGMTSGTTTLWICPDFQPLGGAADYTIDLYPISPVAIGAEAITEALSGGAVAVGSPLSLQVHVPTRGSGDSSGGSSSSSGHRPSIGGPASGVGSGSCPSGFIGSAGACIGLSNSPCDCSNAPVDHCFTANDFAGAGLADPGQCAPEGTTGCLDQNGKLAHPCCSGLTCVFGSGCNEAAVGGVCQRR